MKVRMLFLMIFVPILILAQINESFSDGDYTNNPEWVGNGSNFKINSQNQLQSCALSTSFSSLFTASEFIINAEWSCQFIINYPTSSSNYAGMYIVSDVTDPTNGYNGYYVQIGGTNDEVSLYLQQGTKKTKIIDGRDKRTDGNTINIEIKITRDDKGNFELWSKTVEETEFTSEGKAFNNNIRTSNYTGVFFSNTSTTGEDYIFDNIVVTGEKAIDIEKPEILTLKIISESNIEIEFSEKISYENAVVFVNNEKMTVLNKSVSLNKRTLSIELDKRFQTGEKYKFEIYGIEDYSGNEIKTSIIYSGIPEEAVANDLILNEIMCNNPEKSAEYVEIFNRSNKVIEMTGKMITTRKTDGSLNTGNKITQYLLLYPLEYLALTNAVDSVRKYHNCPEDANIDSLKLSSLNNTAATLVLCSNDKEIIFDEVSYTEKWHHELIKDKKGVALERINPEMPSQNSDSWHSAASNYNYGTPGFKNSQYRDIDIGDRKEKILWCEPEAFSPNNDGRNDLCFVNYRMNKNGYIATAKIFNLDGSLIFELANNKLLEGEGSLIWDGMTKNGNTINAGIYVLYFEAIHASEPKKIFKKIPIVVTF